MKVIGGQFTADKHYMFVCSELLAHYFHKLFISRVPAIKQFWWFDLFKRIVGKPYFNDQFKRRILNVIKSEIQHECLATVSVYMPGCNSYHGL